jgi:hypothetical protein
MDVDRKNGFVTSLNLNAHPLLKAKKKTRLSYFIALAYVVSSCAHDIEFANARLSQYRAMLIDDELVLSLTDEDRDSTLGKVIDDFLKPWKRNYRVLILCDVALILFDKGVVTKACGMLENHLNEKKRKTLSELLKVLYENKAIPTTFLIAENLASATWSKPTAFRRYTLSALPLQ